jgi:hypothetical protein
MRYLGLQPIIVDLPPQETSLINQFASALRRKE